MLQQTCKEKWTYHEQANEKIDHHGDCHLNIHPPMFDLVLLYWTIVMVPVLPGSGYVHILQDVDKFVKMASHPESIDSKGFHNKDC